MAGPLTWRDVSAPNFAASSASQRNAADLLSNGIGGLSDALGKFGADRRANIDRVNAENQKSTDQNWLSGLAQQTDPSSVDRYLQEARANGVSADAIQWGTKQRGVSLADQAAGQANSQTAWNNNNTQSQYAAQPALASFLAQAEALSMSGDPAKMKQAEQMMSSPDGIRIMSEAGFTPDTVAGMQGSTRTSGRNSSIADDAYGQTVRAQNQLVESQGISDIAKSAALDAMQSGGNSTPATAIESIQKSKLDPRAKAEAIHAITLAGEAGIFAPPDESSALLDRLAPQTDTAPASKNTNQGPQRTNPGPRGSALQNLIIQNESGSGGYSTLFGQVQRPGKEFAGVDVSKATIGQLGEFASSDGSYGSYQKNKLGYLATPMGMYQIVGATLKATAKEMGLSPDTVFDENTQDAMFEHLVNKRLSGPRSMQGKIEGLRQEWEGFKNVSDADLTRAITAYENGDRSILTSIGESQGSYSGNSVGENPSSQLLQSASGQDNANTPSLQITNPDAPLGNQPPVAEDPSQSPLRDWAKTQLLKEQKTKRDADANPANSDSIFARNLNGLFDLPKSGEEVNAQLDPITKYINEATQPLFDGISENQAARVKARQAPASETPSQPGPAPVQSAVRPGRQQPGPSQVSPGETLSTSASASEVAQAQPSAANNVQTLIDQGTVDQTFNRNEAVINDLVSRPNKGKTIIQVAKLLTGEGGTMQGTSENAVIAAINETIALSAGGSMAPDIAGTLIANNPETRDLSGWFGLFSGDPYGSPDEGSKVATRVNMKGVAKNIKDLIASVNSDGSVNITKGVAGIQNQRGSQTALSDASQLQALRSKTQSDILSATNAIKNGYDTKANHELLDRSKRILERIEEAAQGLGREPSALSTYSRPAISN